MPHALCQSDLFFVRRTSEKKNPTTAENRVSQISRAPVHVLLQLIPVIRQHPPHCLVSIIALPMDAPNLCLVMRISSGQAQAAVRLTSVGCSRTPSETLRPNSTAIASSKPLRAVKPNSFLTVLLRVTMHRAQLGDIIFVKIRDFGF